MTWTPLVQGPLSDEAHRVGKLISDPIDEVWSSDLYECQVRYLEPRGRGGFLHLSIKRLDREAMRDWRHAQSIKNEVVGWEREAIELFPPESVLVDAANQTHLWVLPVGERLGIGFNERAVATQEQATALTSEKLGDLGIAMAESITARGRQREWEDGLSTGPNYRP